jgi:hypothetical protein
LGGVPFQLPYRGSVITIGVERTRQQPIGTPDGKK